MRLLQFRIGVGDQRPRFAQAKAELAEHPLALAHAQLNPAVSLDPDLKGLPVPQGSDQADFPRRVAEHGLHLLKLRLVQTLGPTAARPFDQPGQASLFKIMNPVLHRAWGVPQQSSCLRTGHALSDQKHPVKAVIVARFLRTANLVLKSENHGSRVGDRKWFHVHHQTTIFNDAQLLMTLCMESTLRSHGVHTSSILHEESRNGRFAYVKSANRSEVSNSAASHRFRPQLLLERFKANQTGVFSASHPVVVRGVGIIVDPAVARSSAQ